MSANVYVIFKNDEPVAAVIGELRDAMREAGGDDWSLAPGTPLSLPEHWEHPGGLAIRRAWPKAPANYRIPSMAVDVYAQPGAGTTDDRPGRRPLPPVRAADVQPTVDWINDQARERIEGRMRRLYGGAPETTGADVLREAIRRADVLKTTAPRPEIRVDRAETFERYVQATGVELIPGDKVTAPSLLGIPVVVDPRMLPGTMRIGDRLFVITGNAVVFQMDAAAGFFPDEARWSPPTTEPN